MELSLTTIRRIILVILLSYFFFWVIKAGISIYHSYKIDQPRIVIGSYKEYDNLFKDSSRIKISTPFTHYSATRYPISTMTYDSVYWILITKIKTQHNFSMIKNLHLIDSLASKTPIDVVYRRIDDDFCYKSGYPQVPNDFYLCLEGRIKNKVCRDSMINIKGNIKTFSINTARNNDSFDMLFKPSNSPSELNLILLQKKNQTYLILGGLKEDMFSNKLISLDQLIKP